VSEPVQIKPAHICSKKLEKIDFYTDLWGNKFNTPHRTLLNVSHHECQDMYAHRTCSEGQLFRKRDGSSYSTGKPLNINYLGPVAGFFTGTQTVQTTNCFVEETLLLYRTSNWEMVSPNYNVKHCNYPDGICYGVKNSTLIWEPNCPKQGCKKCYFRQLKLVSGFYKNGTFRTVDKELVLTFAKQATQARSCEGDLIRISDQGIGIREEEFLTIFGGQGHGKVKREASTTEELAAELSAVEQVLLEKVENLFALQCRNRVVESNPTVLVRRLLGRQDVMARWVGPRLLETHSCAKVLPSSIKFR